MRKYVAFILIASISILYLVSCGGGDGNDEVFTIFDIIVEIEEFEGVVVECPDNVFMRLSLILDESEMSGNAQLFGFDKLGKRVEISGVLEDDFFSLEEFEVQVSIGSGRGRSSLSMSFNEFEGLLSSNVVDESVSAIEGNVAAHDLFYHRGDRALCSGNFSGEFSGKVKIPKGCISTVELSELSKYKNCPAESISNLCNNNELFCSIAPSEPDSMIPLIVLDNSCDSADCSTVVDCETSPDITNLNITWEITGNVLVPEGEGQPVSCFYDF